MKIVRRAVGLLVIFSVVMIGLGTLIVLIPVSLNNLLNDQSAPIPGSYELLPAPWLVPKQAGGSALRLAMIHDVLHERFYLHGEAWFRHRHAQVERELATYDDGSKTKDERYFSLLDDLAVDFDRLGKPAEGIPILRRKLDLQQPFDAIGNRPEPERSFYTTYANLGTLLAHQHLKGALAKDPEALTGLRAGLAFIEQSVVVNPEAHFGRERWQVVTLRYLLYASEHPDFLHECDVTGCSWRDSGQLYHGNREFPRELLAQDELISHLTAGPRSSDEEKLVARIRESIPLLLSGPPEWREHCGYDLALSGSFDEPALAMVGIWTLGSGANPHFALAFAHMMDGLHQRTLAWNAYERTCDLATKFWPDSDVQKHVVDHCRERQAILEKKLNATAASLRENHRTELAYGRAEQQAYQLYESDQITAGKDPSQSGFYDDFFRGRQPIASNPGDADTIVRKFPISVIDVVLVLQALASAILTLVLLQKVIRQQEELAA